MTGASTLAYRRSRFSTRLPLGRRYTAAHYWLDAQEGARFRVGFTKFATRMLGDLVEYRFETAPGASIALGQTLGWVEGFKALSEVYSVVVGDFVGTNPELEQDVTLVDSDPYGRGWLYEARGEADRASVDAQGYVAMLDATIDKMLEKQKGQGDA
ncbi:MAG TPA: glycine cleavage system protein H [Vicinamibacteria bacterium]|nr:glycine cleavage system protein H [Vicinamibacteria bacterium]